MTPPGRSSSPPRHIGDDESDESNSDGSSVMDEEDVVRINFGDSFHSEKGASEPCDDDNSTTTDDEEDSEQPAEIRNIVGKNDWSEAEVAVETWKRAREQRKSDSSAGNSSSGESGTLYFQKKNISNGNDSVHQLNWSFRSIGWFDWLIVRLIDW